MNKSKKILIIFSVIIFLISISIGVYFGIQKSKKILIPNYQNSNNINNNISNENQNNNVINKPKNKTNNYESEVYNNTNIKMCSTKKVVSFWVYLNSNNSSTTINKNNIIYISDDGNIVELNNECKESVISSASDFGVPVYSVSNIDGSFSAVKFDSGIWKLFNVEEETWSDIDSNIQSLSFSSNDKYKIAYIKKENNGKNSIYIKNIKTNKLTLVISLNIFDMKILWPDSSYLVLSPKPSYYAYGTSLKVNLIKHTFSKLEYGNGISYVYSKFNPKYRLIFKPKKEEKSFMDVIFDKNKKLYDLNISTFSDKCYFDKYYIFCSIPVNNNSNSNLIFPDDYLQKAVMFHDDLIRIGIDSLDKMILFEDSNLLHIDAVNLKKINDKLLFINRLDGKLYILSTSDLNANVSTSTNVNDK